MFCVTDSCAADAETCSKGTPALDSSIYSTWYLPEQTIMLNPSSGDGTRISSDGLELN